MKHVWVALLLTVAAIAFVGQARSQGDEGANAGCYLGNGTNQSEQAKAQVGDQTVPVPVGSEVWFVSDHDLQPGQQDTLMPGTPITWQEPGKPGTNKGTVTETPMVIALR